MLNTSGYRKVFFRLLISIPVKVFHRSQKRKENNMKWKKNRTMLAANFCWEFNGETATLCIFSFEWGEHTMWIQWEKNFKLFAQPSPPSFTFGRIEFRFGMRSDVWVREIRFWVPIQMHDGQYTADSIQKWCVKKKNENSERDRIQKFYLFFIYFGHRILMETFMATKIETICWVCVRFWGRNR